MWIAQSQYDKIATMDKLIKFGNNLRAERNRLHMSQEQLAEKVGIQQPHLGKIERGEVDIRFTTLLALMKALNVSFDKLYDLQEK